MRTILVNWPAIIKHEGDAELIHILNQSEWENDSDLNSLEYDEADYLVDSLGNAFTLTHRIDNRVIPEPTGEEKSLIEVLGLVKAHAAQAGSCCVAKLYAYTVNDALEIVRSLK